MSVGATIKTFFGGIREKMKISVTVLMKKGENPKKGQRVKFFDNSYFWKNKLVDSLNNGLPQQRENPTTTKKKSLKNFFLLFREKELSYRPPPGRRW